MTVFWCWKMTSVPTWACSTNYALKSAWLRLATGSTCAQMMLSSTPCKSQCALNLLICSYLHYLVDFSCTQQLVYINLFLWFLSLSWFNLVISFLWCLSNFIHIPCQELLARWAITAGTTSWPLAAGRRVDSGALPRAWGDQVHLVRNGSKASGQANHD